MSFAGVIDEIRSGNYLDRARVRRIAVIYLIAIIVSFAILLATSDGFKDQLGRPLGTDFMAFHVAGSVASAEGGAAAYDSQKQYAAHQKILGEEAPPYWPYLYPPAFVFVTIALAALPYLAGWFAWMGATMSLYAAAMQRLAPGGFALLLTLSLPAAYANFLHGQNGFLIAALFAFGLHALFGGRPILAGIALGLIAIKPQYGVLIPIALAAGGYWRAFAAASFAVALQIVLPVLVFGPEVWTGFFETMRAARVEVVEAGAIGFEKIQSVFAQARFLGAPVGVAYALQAIAALSLALAILRLWRGKASNETKGAGLIIAAILATPYAVDYDLVILAPAMAFLIREGLKGGFLPYEKTILLFAAFAPVIARGVGGATHISLGLLALLALFSLVLRRGR